MRNRLERARRQIKDDLARKAAKTEKDVTAEETKRDYLHKTLEENDIEMVRLNTIDQESKYDVYANSNGPASTRPLGY